MDRSRVIGAIGGSLAIVVLAIGICRYIENWPRIWDLSMWDETLYLQWGVYDWGGRMQYFESSPLYSWLYHIAYQWIRDPINLFYTVGRLDVVGAIVAVFLAVWSISRRLFVAAAIIPILVFSHFMMAEPRLIYPAIAILSLGIAAAYQFRLFAMQCCILALATFLATFIRPEFVLSFDLFLAAAAAAWIIAVIKQRNEITYVNVALSLLSIAAIFTLSRLWTFPVLSGGDRAMFAFGQHFALYFSLFHTTIPDAFVNWTIVTNKVIPGVHSELGALFRYPSIVLPFLAFNIDQTLQVFGATVENLFKNHLAFTAVLIATIIAVIATSPVNRYRLHVSMRSAISDFLIWAFLSMPLVISLVFIFARMHYLIMISVFFAFGVAMVARYFDLALSGVAALVVSVAFAASVVPAPAITQENLQTVESLRHVAPFGKALEMDGGWCIYAKGICASSFAIDLAPGTDLMKLFSSNAFSGIFVSNNMVNYAVAHNQRDFVKALTSVPQGWTAVKLSDKATLLFRH